MYCIGIDVGSTFTKYCVMADRNIDFLFMERTPIRQREYFKEKLASFMEEYPDAKVTSCGYGKRNVSELKSINELTALAKGFFFVTGKDGIILDIGGQDTKIISQENGKLKKFFINDKCAAGSGMFLSNILDMIGIKFQDIDLRLKSGTPISLSSTCAVFAQSEIVELIANNRTGILADISRILTERQIDVKSLNSRTSKQGIATINMAFEIQGKEELNRLVDKLRNVESIIDIERTSG